MKPLSQQVTGTLYLRKDKLGLLLDRAAPAVLLRYAFVTQGTNQPIFPALALDDWGRERDTLGLYRWVYEEGPRFPRSEIFGFERSGAETQVFLRALETFFKFPCYAYPDREAPLRAGQRVHVIFVEGEGGMGEIESIAVPDTVSWPLRHAAVSWQAATRTGLARAGWEPAQKGETS